MTIGKRIAKCRKEKNYSQEYIAELLEVSRQAVSKWETDQTEPDTGNLIKLAKVFNVSKSTVHKDLHERLFEIDKNLYFDVEKSTHKVNTKIYEYLLKAKVVVEDTKGIPSLSATAFPQTAIESATIQSGCNRSISLHTISSSANVVSTKSFVEKAKSFPTLAVSFGSNFNSVSYSSQGTNFAPVASIFSFNIL